MRSDLEDLSLFIHAETERAILVSDDGEQAKAVWLPKSQVEIDDMGVRVGGVRTAIVTCPEWLAKDKGLI